MTWQEAAISMAGMVFVLVLFVVVIMQGAATWRARTVVAREEAHRKLAEEATRAQQETARQLEKVLAELAVIREKTTALERALAEVGEPWEKAR